MSIISPKIGNCVLLYFEDIEVTKDDRLCILLYLPDQYRSKKISLRMISDYFQSAFLVEKENNEFEDLFKLYKDFLYLYKITSESWRKNLIEILRKKLGDEKYYIPNEESKVEVLLRFLNISPEKMQLRKREILINEDLNL